MIVAIVNVEHTQQQSMKQGLKSVQTHQQKIKFLPIFSRIVMFWLRHSSDQTGICTCQHKVENVRCSTVLSCSAITLHAEPEITVGHHKFSIVLVDVRPYMGLSGQSVRTKL